jgi:hypothetical protein
VIASILFNAVALTVWRMNFGSKPAVISGWRLEESEPGGAHHGAGSTGPPETQSDEHVAPPDPFNARLRLEAKELEHAKQLLTPLLEERVKKWRIAEVATREDGTSLVELDLRIRKSTDLVEFVRAIEQGAPLVSKVELTKLDQKKHKRH